MDIGKVAKASGLPPSTLRYYEEKALIQSQERKGLRRQYAPMVIQRLALITLGRNAGFSLDEIRSMFTAKGADINRTLLASKADELDQKINELTAMRDGLRHAAACSAANHFECPKFLRLLKLANNSKRREHKLR